jgi:peptidyl-dipeptidase Dcp
MMNPSYRGRFGLAILLAVLWNGSGLCQNASDSSSSTAKTMPSTLPFDRPSTLPLEAPPFDAIKVEHYRPGFEIGMAKQLAEVQSIAQNPEAPTFENTLIAMEKTGEVLRRVQAVFFHMTGANSDKDLQAIEEEVAPKLASHSDNIYLNAPLFARIETLWAKREGLALNEEQQRLLKEQYEQFIRAGAMLNAQQQQRIREINEQLSTLTTQFQNNLLAITQEQAVIVDSLNELDGLDASDIAAAAEAAAARKLEGKYLLSITNTTRQPVLISLNHRPLRKRVWEASALRGLGRDGKIDNRPLVLQIAKLRAEKAAMLGYPNHAAYTLENQMAETPTEAMKMLREMSPKVVANVRKEAEKIKAMMAKLGDNFELEPWDWEYYAEKVRREEYQIDENLTKPYFELDSVLKNGVFHTFNLLYGITFKERHDLPVYHSDVRVFDVIDSQGLQLGLFYADYLNRDGKRGGAWMDAWLSQSRLMNRKPVVVNVMNIPRAAAGEPTLLTLDLVQTMFHEMGHGVHGLFSAVEYPTLSGTSVPRDFVEFPSTFHEDWAIEPSVLANYARHNKTGEVIPADLLQKAVQASKFNKGFDTLEYLSAAILDLAWHSLTIDQIPTDVEAFEAKVLADYGLDYRPVPPRYRTAYFAHVWSGGYSSSYYAYLWSEVLAADAFAFMKSRQGLNRANGQAFRDKILSRGGTREVSQQYIDFRGQEASVDPLLIRRGLKAN